MRKLTMIAALLVSTASACSNQPEPQSASHPLALDLVCLAEPPSLTDAEIAADDASEANNLGRPNEEQFNNDVLLAGRDCRDTLRRACQFHAERGDKDVDCGKARVP